MIESRTLVVRTVLIWLLLELLAATQVRSSAGVPILWEWLRTLAQPAVWMAQQIGESTTNLVFGLRNTRQLMIDNTRLRTELEEARTRILLMDEDRAALREALSMLDIVPGLESSAIAGRCVYRNPRLGRMEIRIGSSAVVPRDTPVLSSKGLVGRVVQSARNRCWIELVTHPVAAAAVQTQTGAVHGLVTGNGTLELGVRYVPRAAALLRGDVLITSGADGIYPPGIPVAEVTRIRESDATFLEVAAAPLVDPATVRVVLLLLDWSGEVPGVEER